jgi:hypothetical protein
LQQTDSLLRAGNAIAAGEINWNLHPHGKTFDFMPHNANFTK